MRNYSNYHSINTKDKLIHDGNYVFEYTLQNSTEATEVLIGEGNHTVIIQTKSNDSTGEQRNILCKPDLIDRGTLVNQDDATWMVTTLPIDNGIYTKATIQLCNTSLTIKGESEPIEFDRWGNPTEYSDGEPINIVCIADKSLVYGSVELNKPINIPDNKIKVTIPYTDVKFEEFYLYDELYLVRDIDLTQSINGVGLITITGERVVKNEST